MTSAIKINHISGDDIGNSKKGELMLFKKFRATALLAIVLLLFIVCAQFVGQGFKKTSQHEDMVNASVSDRGPKVRITNLNIPTIAEGYNEE